MKFCISQATTLPQSFADDVNAYADAKVPGIEVWLTKLEKHLETATVSATKDLLYARAVTPAAAAYQGGLLLAQGEQRKAAFELFKRRLDICAEFAIPTLIVLTDFAQKFDPTALQRAVVSLAQAAQWAAGYNVRLAVEFRATDTFCTCLETTLFLVGECGERNVGINLDWFHFMKGPSKTEELRRLTTENLFHVQVADVAGIPRELATDSDRVLPGEGDFDLTPLVQTLRRLAYTGWVSLELFNPVLWQAKPSQVAELGLASLERSFSMPLA